MKLSQYLQFHGGKYRVRLIVPEHLREVLGKTALLHPLHTADIRKAAERKWPVVSEFKALLSQAEKVLRTEDPITKEALRTRLFVQQGEREYDAGDGEVYIVNDEEDAAVERAYEIERKHGLAAAHRYANIALGQETPLAQYVDQSCTDRDLKAKTKGDLLRVLGWLDEWLVGSGKTNSIEAVDRKTAGEFLRGKLHRDRSARKAKAYLSFLRTYWEWMIEVGYYSGESPWAGLKVRQSKQEALSKVEARPFTNGEVVSLLSTHAPEDREFLMRVAALTGMRVSDIMGINLSQCTDGMFRILDGKTANARREFPIHPALANEVKRRTEAYHPNDPLIWSQAADPASAASKNFTRFRRKLGIGAQKGTARDRSEVNFHSFRRWFVNEVRVAMENGATGFGARTLASILGHVEGDLVSTMEALQRLYAGKPTVEAQQALLETVKLPEGIPTLLAFKRPPRRRSS